MALTQASATFEVTILSLDPEEAPASAEDVQNHLEDEWSDDGYLVTVTEKESSP